MDSIQKKEYQLLRDCEAILIPDGFRTVLKKNDFVEVTQALGGSVTVHAGGNLLRISKDNLDALGIETESGPMDYETDNSVVDETAIWNELRNCYDPEIPINIVELGLIYRCDVLKKDDENLIEIDMTLTAPGCGMGPFLVEDVRSKVSALPFVHQVEVELVFDPPWNPEMMSEAAKLETGML